MSTQKKRFTLPISSRCSLIGCLQQGQREELLNDFFGIS